MDNEQQPILINQSYNSISEHISIHEPKRRFWKNLICLCVSFLCIFIPFVSIQNLSSSLYQEEGLGVAMLACVYGGVLTFCIIAPYGVQIGGCKTMLISGFIAQSLFVLANRFPSFYTLIPVSLLIGIMSSFMWTAQGRYITALSFGYSELVQETPNTVLSKFNGIFFFFFQNSQVWGNILTSFILLQHSGSKSSVSIGSTEQCGMKFCGRETNSNITRHPLYEDNENPSENLIHLMIYIFLCLDAFAIILSILVLDKRNHAFQNAGQSLRDLVSSTLKIHTDKKMLLLILWFVWNGMEQGFLFGEYTQAFPGCVLGLEHIGYVMVGFGAVNALSALVVGWLERITGRIALFAGAVLLNVSVLVILIIWDPKQGPNALLYVLPFLWGVADSIWQATTCTFIGIVFQSKQEPAFAAFRMWQAGGFVIIFASSHFFCMNIKIFAAIACCAVANVCYVLVELVIRRG